MLKKKKLVKWVKPGPQVGWAYFPGDTAKIEAKEADKLIEANFCVELGEPEKKQPEKKTAKKSGSAAKSTASKSTKK